ncbi:AmmeMemoRadiSam system protein B [Patescibacteria group bacterium]|nr:AmmeMemoRadiSam system protein B [Patescibacteria group bacterium]MBU4580676.1 AmmeMemoRadiSam system protein B [Patescibacteria group bacterium]
MICFAAIAPHPPIIIPGIGRGKNLKRVQKTILAMERLRQDLEKAKPDTIIIVSPHAPPEFDSFGINSREKLKGDLLDFGLAKKFEFSNDLEIAGKIRDSAPDEKISAHFRESALDHGALVPLYYLTKNIKPKIVHLSFTFLDYSVHFRYGKIIGNVSRDDSKKIAIIASGDLSHRLIPGAPAGYSARGKEFDRTIIEHLENRKIKKILALDKALVEEAGECGLRSIIMLLGILSGQRYDFNLLNYEGPFGVGYMVGRMF